MENKRIVYFDILNIIAMVAVVAMHCNEIVHSNPNIRAWNSSLIVNCICYWAIPVFCMLSGATLINYKNKYDTKTFFKKRINKVLIPFAFWIFVMAIWKIFILKNIDVSQWKFSEWINAIMSNKFEFTYYFMFTMLGIYLTIPFLSLVAKEENRKMLWLTVGLFFIFNSFIGNILGLFKVNYNTSLSIQFGNYIIFVILGYLLSTQELKKSYRILIYVGTAIGLIFQYTITFLLSKKIGYVVKTTWGYSTWHSILLACTVFLIVKQIFSNVKFNDKVANMLSTISSCSFGIYLIHKIIMHYELAVLKFININSYSWEWRTFGVIATYIISLCVVYIMKKIPIIKKIVP